jgi:hypothetical protein
MSAVVALQKYALGGRPAGPFFRNLPIARPSLFMLEAWVDDTFQLYAVRQDTFQLIARVQEPFQLGA